MNKQAHCTNKQAQAQMCLQFDKRHSMLITLSAYSYEQTSTLYEQTSTSTDVPTVWRKTFHVNYFICILVRTNKHTVRTNKHKHRCACSFDQVHLHIRSCAYWYEQTSQEKSHWLKDPSPSLAPPSGMVNPITLTPWSEEKLNKHTPYVCGFAWSDMEHGCMMSTGLAPRWLQFHVASAMSAL